jgi:hypothetical protein
MNARGTHVALDLHQLVVQFPPSCVGGGHRILQDCDLAEQVVHHIPLPRLAQNLLEGGKLPFTSTKGNVIGKKEAKTLLVHSYLPGPKVLPLCC